MDNNISKESIEELLGWYHLVYNCSIFIGSIELHYLVESLQNEVKLTKKSSQFYEVMTDKEFYDILKNLESEKDRNYILELLDRRKISKLKEALSDKFDIFFEGLNRDKLKDVKILLGLWYNIKSFSQKLKEFIDKIETEGNSNEIMKIADDYHKSPVLELIYGCDKSLQNMSVEFDNDLKLSDDKMELCYLTIWIVWEQFFRLMNEVSCPKNEEFWKILSDSEYADPLQDLYDAYWMNNEGIVRRVISVERSKIRFIDKSRNRHLSLECGKDRKDIRAGLSDEAVEFLYLNLLREGYIAFDTDINRFSFFLSGYPDCGNTDKKIKWEREIQDLAYFVGFIKKDKGINKAWKITFDSFTSENEKFTSKSLAAAFSNAKEENDSYKYLKELITRAKKRSKENTE